MEKNIKERIEKCVIGKIVAEHDAFGHHYRFVETNTLVDSVTGVLKILEKEHLVRWAIRVGIEWLEKGNQFEKLKDPNLRNQLIVAASTEYTTYRDDAGSVGTAAHKAIEKYIDEWVKTNKLPTDIKDFISKEADPRAIAAVRAVERFFKTENVVPIASEILVGDERYSAGTLDFLCLWNNKLTLVDFKTSNQVSDDFSMQVAAYKYFFEHMTGLKIKDTKILHLSKDMDKFTVYNIVKPAKAYKAFKGLCSAFRWRIQDKDQKIIKDIKRKTI